MDWTFTEEEFSAFMDAQYEKYAELRRVTDECAQPQIESRIITRPKGDGLPFQVEGRTIKVINGVANDPFKYAA